MRRFFNLFIVLSIFSLIFLNSCGVDMLNALGENEYYVVRYSNGSPKPDVASTEYIGNTDRLLIYVENGYSYSTYNIKQVAQKFEDNYTKMINIYGNHTDLDNNGKIKLIFVDINKNNNSGSMIRGYFLPSDLIRGKGNNGEILYMDINLLNSKPSDIAGTVLHEFQHLINYNVNALKKGREMSLWLDECLAESTAVLFDDNIIKSRIKEFNNINYYCFYTWYLPYSVSQNSLINYPSAAVFMNWLYIKNGNKSDIFKNIASSYQTEDYNKVLKSVSYSSWKTLLTDWINGVKNGQVSGASIKTRSYSASLYPGAAIYDGSKVQVNESTELANPEGAVITVRANSVSGRSALNNNDEEIILNLQNMENNQETKYIDLVFDRNGKIREY